MNQPAGETLSVVVERETCLIRRKNSGARSRSRT